METEPLERIDEHASGETPEDVAILYSWANLQGAKYRDFSANRREYRAQMRHRAAEQLRMMELRAQSEAEAAAAQAEAEAAAAHAEADAATVKLAASRSMPAIAPEAILEEKEVEQLRNASLREAAQQARRAAAERLEAARRAEAAALADSIARREEREIAEAQASALRQAAQYHDSEMKSRQMMAQHPEDQVPGHLNDPYSPQILAEGEYYDGPGTPPSELQASRFRMQREYIEKATGTELPPFKMPHLPEDRQPSRFHPPEKATEFASADRPGDYARAPEPRNSARDSVRDSPRNVGPRRIADMNPEDRDYFMERHLREDRNASLPYRRESAPLEPRGARPETAPDRFTVPSTPYSESHFNGSEPGRFAKAEVVSRIPETRGDLAWERDEYGYGPDREEARFQRRPEGLADQGADQRAEQRPERRPEQRPAQRPERRPDAVYDGSLLSPASPRPVPSKGDYAPATSGRPQREPEWGPESVDPWMYQRSAPPARSAELGQPGAHGGMQPRGGNHSANERADLFEDGQSYPAPPNPSPRPSGSWLQRISGGEKQAEKQNERRPASVRPTSRPDAPSRRPSVEATYSDGLTDADLTQAESQPSGFRPPWLTQAQAPRPSGLHNAAQPQTAPDQQKPRWLYTEPSAPEITPQASAPAGAAPQKSSPQGESKPEYQAEHKAEQKAEAANTAQGSTLQASQEAVASRWFALKGVFSQADAPEHQTPREKSRAASAPVPTIAVFSLAGGVGKTSLVATLGRALSSLGEKVLLADTTSHGLLPFYFGAKELHPGVVRTFAPPNGSTDATVHMVSYGLDAPGVKIDGQRKMVDELLASSKQVNRVLIDVSSNGAWIVEKLAGFKPMVLVPLAADMNSIVSLQMVDKIFSAMRDADGEPLRPVYLLNQFDASLPLHLDVREVLRQQLGDRLLPLAVRRAAGVSEALAEGMTIVDYDPDSSAAQDFLGLANWIRAVSTPATAGFRNLRWSER